MGLGFEFGFGFGLGFGFGFGLGSGSGHLARHRVEERGHAVVEHGASRW